MNEDEKWMKIAIQEAIKAEKDDEVPVGAVLVKDGLIIAKAHNQPILTNDATAHAEIQVLRKAAKKRQNYRLVGTTLYVTLEPCIMCLGAIMHSRVDRVVFGASDHKTGVFGLRINNNNENFFKHNFEVSSGILEKQCSRLLVNFFKSRR